MVSTIENYLYNGTDELIGSFSDCKILPNGEIAIAVWNSGNIGMGSGIEDRYYPIVLEDGVGIRNILLPNSDKLITNNLLVSEENIQNYSGVGIFQSSQSNTIGLMFSSYKSQFPSFVARYRYKSGVVSGSSSYLEDLVSNHSSGVVRPPDPAPDTFFWQGAYGGCVSDLYGRVLTWVSNGTVTDNSGAYDQRLAIYDSRLEDYHYSDLDIVLSRSCRTANLLPNGNIIFLCSSHAVIYNPKHGYVTTIPGALSSFYPVCSTLHPLSGSLYFNSNRANYNAIYRYDYLTDQLIKYDDPNNDVFGQHWTMQPLPSDDLNVDKMVMFPGVDATSTVAKIVEFDKSSNTFSVTDDIDVGTGYGCSVLTSSGYILLFTQDHGIVKKYIPDTPYNWSSRITNSIFMTGK